MQTIITYGTFDLLHQGHLNLFKTMRQIVGEQGAVIVAVSTDEFNIEKGKKACQTYEERVKAIKELGIADLVIDECGWDQKWVDVDSLLVDIFIMGADWCGKFDELPCTVLYKPRTPDISSTRLREKMKDEN